MTEENLCALRKVSHTRYLSAKHWNRCNMTVWDFKVIVFFFFYVTMHWRTCDLWMILSFPFTTRWRQMTARTQLQMLTTRPSWCMRRVSVCSCNVTVYVHSYQCSFFFFFSCRLCSLKLVASSFLGPFKSCTVTTFIYQSWWWLSVVSGSWRNEMILCRSPVRRLFT